MTLDKVRAFRLLKTAHIKIAWVSCRVHGKMVANICYRCLSFSNVAAHCEGPDRSKDCWR